MATTLENFKLNYVAADKGYLSNENLEMIHGRNGEIYIPFKSNSTDGNGEGIWGKMYHYFQYRRQRR